MTNIQEIDLLKGLEKSLDDYCGLNDEGKTAFHMAITALYLLENNIELRFRSGNDRYTLSVSKLVEGDRDGT